MFTVKLAAKELGVSASLLYGLIAAGRIRHERHGLGRGTIRIPPEALEEYRQLATIYTARAVKPAVARVKLKHITL